MASPRSHNMNDRAEIQPKPESSVLQNHVLKIFKCLAGLNLTCFQDYILALRDSWQKKKTAGQHEKAPSWQLRDLYPWPSSAVFLPRLRLFHLFDGRAGLLLCCECLWDTHYWRLRASSLPGFPWRSSFCFHFASRVFKTQRVISPSEKGPH